MVIETMSRLRGRVAGSVLARVLRRLGLRDLVMRPYERAILRRGWHGLEVAGRTVRFQVAGPAEVTCLDWFWALEGPLVERLLRALQPGDVLFDVGANLGVISVIAAMDGRPRGVTIHAFEPQQELAERIPLHARLNGCEDNLHVHPVALGQQPGQALLFPHAVNRGAASMVPGEHHRGAPRWVSVERGEDVARRLGVRPGVVKIDVEGFETDVLEGMKGVLRPGGVREIFIELHLPVLARRGQSEESVLRWLGERHYRSVWRRPRGGEVQHHLVQGG
ncbi:MAG: hypothetical protein KatS3mg102_2655 [Planctomycetota bacterium]|nr:MAG: hypothetical protein KatS3mg102_2655 [Planctomycetota bacterium]